MSKDKMQRPCGVDDFDKFKERMLGSEGRKAPPHKRALLFVDNSSADIVLGMLPLARDLHRCGTEVVLVANSLPALNDVTCVELLAIIAEAAKPGTNAEEGAEGVSSAPSSMDVEPIPSDTSQVPSCHLSREASTHQFKSMEAKGAEKRQEGPGVRREDLLDDTVAAAPRRVSTLDHIWVGSLG